MNIVFPSMPRSPKWSIPFIFSDQFKSPPFILHVPSHCITRRVQIVKFLVM